MQRKNWGELNECVDGKTATNLNLLLLICLSCLRTLLPGDYEFLKLTLMQFGFPRKMRCNKSFDIVNFNSSRHGDLCLWSLKSLLHYFRSVFFSLSAISFSDFEEVKNV